MRTQRNSVLVSQTCSLLPVLQWSLDKSCETPLYGAYVPAGGTETLPELGAVERSHFYSRNENRSVERCPAFEVDQALTNLRYEKQISDISQRMLWNNQYKTIE